MGRDDEAKKMSMQRERKGKGDEEMGSKAEKVMYEDE